MTVSNAKNEPTTRVFNRGFARWLGAGVAGMAAWIFLGFITALLDPRAMGTGLLGPFDSLAARLGTGAALTAAVMSIYGVHRYGFGRRATIGVVLVAAAEMIFLVVMHWNAIVQIILSIGGIIGVAYLFRYGDSTSSFTDDENSFFSDDDGWRDGPDGYGWYLNGLKVD